MDKQLAPNWVLGEAIMLATEIEKVCPAYGCHVALTGGLLYSPGKRKDCDLLFYRIRQVKDIDLLGLQLALEDLGLNISAASFGLWVSKATYYGKAVDFFFPESKGDGESHSKLST